MAPRATNAEPMCDNLSLDSSQSIHQLRRLQVGARCGQGRGPPSVAHHLGCPMPHPASHPVSPVGGHCESDHAPWHTTAAVVNGLVRLLALFLWVAFPLALADLGASTAPSAPKLCPRKAKDATGHQPEVGANESAPSAK
eukprot:1884839-Amphidinium_carterae.1